MAVGEGELNFSGGPTTIRVSGPPRHDDFVMTVR
jgi:hypothetical protein